MPPISAICLASLSDDPDGLLDEVEEVVMSGPPAPIGDWYRRLFDALAQARGRQAWVERSGVSLRYLGETIRHFPRARFLHLYRDGRACALSMSRHHGVRLYVVRDLMIASAGVDPFSSPEAARAAVGRLPRKLEPCCRSTSTGRRSSRWSSRWSASAGSGRR